MSLRDFTYGQEQLVFIERYSDRSERMLAFSAPPSIIAIASLLPTPHLLFSCLFPLLTRTFIWIAMLFQYILDPELYILTLAIYIRSKSSHLWLKNPTLLTALCGHYSANYSIANRGNSHIFVSVFTQCRYRKI